MFESAAAYAMAVFAMLVAGASAITLITAVRHFDPPEVSEPPQDHGHAKAA
jgi:hypothetical protein